MLCLLAGGWVCPAMATDKNKKTTPQKAGDAKPKAKTEQTPKAETANKEKQPLTTLGLHPHVISGIKLYKSDNTGIFGLKIADSAKYQATVLLDSVYVSYVNNSFTVITYNAAESAKTNNIALDGLLVSAQAYINVAMNGTVLKVKAADLLESTEVLPADAKAETFKVMLTLKNPSSTIFKAN